MCGGPAVERVCGLLLLLLLCTAKTLPVASRLVLVCLQGAMKATFLTSGVCVFAGRDEGDVQGDERQPGAGARARQRLLPGAAARQGAWRQGVDRGLDVIAHRHPTRASSARHASHSTVSTYSHVHAPTTDCAIKRHRQTCRWLLARNGACASASTNGHSRPWCHILLPLMIGACAQHAFPV